MHKLFDRLLGKETQLVVEFNCYAENSPSDTYKSEFVCSCSYMSGFKDTCERIILELELLQSQEMKSSSFEIKFNGKLNGQGIHSDFKDLNSFDKFLEDNSLPKRSDMKLFNQFNS